MRKFIAIILTFVTLIGIIPFQSVYAADAGDKMNFSISHYAKEKGNGALYSIPQGNGIEFVDPYEGKYHSGSWCDVGVFTGTGGTYAYCIQKGTAFYSGDRTAVDPDKSNAYAELSEDAQTGIKLAMLYGFPKGKIKIVKTTEDGETPLAGVQFIVRDKDRMVVANLFTDENGLAETGLLPKGQYTIKEVETQESYVLDEHEHFVRIEKHGDVATFGLINEKIRGQIQIIKTDGKTRFPLEGVVFEVRGADGNVIAELTTDKDGKAITEELVYGKYTVVEKSTLTEYILNDTPQEVFIKEHKKVVELEMQNTKITGKIKVFKTDGKTKTPLDGVVFEVFDKDGKIVSTITTDKDGIAITEDLDYGDYTIKEHTAKEGYVLDETVHEIQIREHEKVYELNITNNKIPEQPKTPDTPKTPDSPKTGDESNMGLWLAIMGIAVVGIGVLAFVSRRKKKQGTEE